MLNVPTAVSLNALIMYADLAATIVNVKSLKRLALSSSLISEASERNPN